MEKKSLSNMYRSFAALVGLLVFVLTPMAWAVSIFETRQVVRGKVVALIVEDQVRIKLRSVEPKAKTVRLQLCDLSEHKNLAVDELRHAMSFGKTVKLAYSGIFNRCLSSIETES